MEYNREMWILLGFIAVGAVIYVGFAEYSMILFNENFDYWQPNKDLGLLYNISTRVMLFGLFVSGVSILVLCRKLERLNIKCLHQSKN